MKSKVKIVMLPMERVRRCSFREEDCRRFVWKRKFDAFCGMAAPAFMLCLPLSAAAFFGALSPSELAMLPVPFIPALFVAVFLRPGKDEILDIMERWEKYEELFAEAELKGDDPEMTVKEISRRTNVAEERVMEDISWMRELGLISYRWYNADTGVLYLPAMSAEEYAKLFPEEDTGEEEKESAAHAKAETEEPEKAEEEDSPPRTELGDYAEKIDELNGVIRDEEMSRKLSALETTVSGLVEYVKKHPENEPQARGLADYYLPTMIKLLSAYAELEEQPVKTKKTEKIKEDIEQCVDTMNRAVGNLFVKMLEDTEADISTDISVMTTKAVMDGLLPGETAELHSGPDF